MKRLIILLLPVLLIVGCSSKEPINRDLMLIERDRLYYTKDTNKPYSGRVFTLYDNGENKLECGYKDGELDGLYTLWNKNGQKRKESNYKDGKLNGLIRFWYENGQKREEGTYKDGESHHELFTVWYENGQKKIEGTFKDGDWISKKEWNEDGSPR